MQAGTEQAIGRGCLKGVQQDRGGLVVSVPCMSEVTSSWGSIWYHL